MITLTLSAITVSTYSMVNEEFSTNRRSPSPQTVETNFYNVKKLPYVFLVTGITAISSILSGFLGYKIGKDRRLDDEKEVTLIGTILPYDITPYDGEYYIDRVLNNFINKLFSEDIPKLSRENEFPATYLAALESELKILSLRFNGEELSYKYKEFGRELLSMSQHISIYVDKANKNITVGYLKKLLKDTQKLLKEATANLKEIELSKEQNKAEL